MTVQRYRQPVASPKCSKIPERKRVFSHPSKWRNEIVSAALDAGVGDTDDLSQFLAIWIWFNKSKNQTGSVRQAARVMGRIDFTIADALDAIDESTAMYRALPPGAMSKTRIADTVARLLRVDFATRQRLGFTKIGAYDFLRKKRMQRRKELNRQAKERKRRESDARPQSESISQKEPWAKEGISRAKWYRQEKDRKWQMIEDYFADLGPAKGPSK